MLEFWPYNRRSHASNLFFASATRLPVSAGRLDTNDQPGEQQKLCSASFVLKFPDTRSNMSRRVKA